MHLLFVLIPLVAAFAGMVGAIVSGFRLVRPGRLPRPRRMVHYRVHYDDWLGTRPDIKGVAELVVRRRGHDVPDASLVMIRLSNEGGLDVGKEHWIIPVNFTFDGRDVVGVEVSDAHGVPQGLLTGDQEHGGAAADGESIRISKGKKALELPRIDLKRKDRIRLLVLLSGARERMGPAVVGDASIKGAVRGGGLVREVTRSRENFYTFGWTGFALLALIAAVVVTLVVRPFSSTVPAAAADCAAGNIVAAGSTAFAPTVSAVAQNLMQQCPSSVVAVNPPTSAQGSVGAAAELQDTGGSSASIRATNLVMSDGRVKAAVYPNLVAHPIAIVIFSVVVNTATKVNELTEAQIEGIWTGKYKNWRELGGANLPIDIIARTADSGTRATFEAKVLHGAELPASSSNCTSPNPNAASPVILCEKSSTDLLLQTVNAIPGAIGYAEHAQAEQYRSVEEISLDGRDANPGTVKTSEYPFWAVENLYTYGTPTAGSLLSAFLSYMTTDAAKSIMQGPDYEDIPCSLTTLCG
jgi:phosphate transport system substrate-binding protein